MPGKPFTRSPFGGCAVKVFRWLFWIFAALYALSFLSYFAWLFGAIRGPFLVSFLIPTGMPWILLADYLPRVMIAAPGSVWSVVPWSVLLAPAINLLILFLLARWARK